MSEQDDHIRELMRAAVDQAFIKCIGRLFDNWVLDPGGQPARAAVGAQKTIAIYREAMAVIDTVEL